METLRSLIEERAVARWQLAGIKSLINDVELAAAEVLSEAGLTDEELRGSIMPTERNEFADLAANKETMEQRIKDLTLAIRHKSGQMARARVNLPPLPEVLPAATDTPALATAGAGQEGVTHD